MSQPRMVREAFIEFAKRNTPRIPFLPAFQISKVFVAYLEGLVAVVPGGSKRAMPCTSADGRWTTSECGRGRGARGGWCEQVIFHVCIGLVNIF